MRLFAVQQPDGEVEFWVGANYQKTFDDPVRGRLEAVEEAKLQAAHRKVALILEAVGHDGTWFFRVHPNGQVDVLEGDPDERASTVVADDARQVVDSEPPPPTAEDLAAETQVLATEAEALAEEIPVVEVVPAVVPNGVANRGDLVLFGASDTKPARSRWVSHLVLVAAAALVVSMGFVAWSSLSSPELITEAQSEVQSDPGDAAGTIESDLSDVKAAAVSPTVGVVGGGGRVLVKVVDAPGDLGGWKLWFGDDEVPLVRERSTTAVGVVQDVSPGSYDWRLVGPEGQEVTGQWEVR